MPPLPPIDWATMPGDKSLAFAVEPAVMTPVWVTVTPAPLPPAAPVPPTAAAMEVLYSLSVAEE